MKHIAKIVILLLVLINLASCNNWLLEPQPGKSGLESFFTEGKAATQAINGAYVPLMWEFSTTYYPEWMIGDIMSDDALKGGQSIADMADVYYMENFKATANNTLLLEFYRAQFQGVARCNLAIREVEKMKIDSTLTVKLKSRLIGEAKFLRALYNYRLVRVFGGVPKIDFVIESSQDWLQARASINDIYDFIVEDLEAANKGLWKKSEYNTEDLGRATKGAAQAMLLKINLTIATARDDNSYFSKAEAWGDSIINSGEYSLMATVGDNFLAENENGIESVFEIQYMEEPTSDFGSSIPGGGAGATRGTFTTIMTRSRSSLLGGGWGMNKPTQNLLNAFETGDPRKDITILDPTGQIENESQEIYLGCKYLNRKYYGMESTTNNNNWIKISHQSRSPINNRYIRYADVLLMYAEACVETNNSSRAKWALEEVRSRSRGSNSSKLPTFPNYNNYSDNKDDLRKAVRQERRVELAMEGHRWFDLCRWKNVKEVMDAYKLTETSEAQAEMSSFRVGINEILPIPMAEIELNPQLTQNPGY